MPLTLALTPDDRRSLAHAGEQWRLLLNMPFECRSIPTAEYLLEHGRHIAGSSELLGRMFSQLECDVERADLIGAPMEPTERRQARSSTFGGCFASSTSRTLFSGTRLLGM